MCGSRVSKTRDAFGRHQLGIFEMRSDDIMQRTTSFWTGKRVGNAVMLDGFRKPLPKLLPFNFEKFLELSLHENFASAMVAFPMQMQFVGRAAGRPAGPVIVGVLVAVLM